MNRIIAFLFLLTMLSTISANGQQPPKQYDKEWKAVEQLINKRLPASALTEVKKIYALAKKEKQDAQVIKSLLYMMQLQQGTREDNELLSIKETDQEIRTAAGPARRILYSLEAELYLSYFQRNRYKLYNRTSTSEKGADIATWSADQLHQKIGSLYLSSLEDARQLQQTRLESFDALIVKGNVRHLRPTLFDLLAHRALAYFQNDERSISRPAYAFEINSASAFDPAADFIHRKFETKDSASLQHKALLIYQQLIAFHLNDVKPDALIDVDLQRIGFVYRESSHPDKEQQYFNIINHIAHQYGNTPAAAQAWYLVAAYHEKNAATYSALRDTSHRYDRITARSILETILAQKDSSEGKVNAFNLLNEINKPQLHFEVEKVNLPGQSFRALIGYRNAGSVYLRIVKADEELKVSLRDIYNDKAWPAILAAPAVRSWQQALPLTNDLQLHHTEVKVDALPAGDYILIAASTEKFTDAATVIGARLFYVSTISYVNEGADYFVLHRETGKPLDATVQVWDNRYDYTLRKNTSRKLGSFKTDANGHFTLKDNPESKQSNYGRVLEVRAGNEQLKIDDAIDYYYEPYLKANEEDDDKEYEKPRAFMFMDRGIYRPGQTVYFKAIILHTNKGTRRSEPMTGFKTVVSLYNANNEIVDSIPVTSNDFGSVTGKFTLPMGGITGDFSLQIEDLDVEKDFKVEEYKRPKFEVAFKPLSGTYQVNDQVQVTGTATAYAGNQIDGASVTYRVVRQPRFIYPWLYRGWFPPSEPQEIAHGEVKTDGAGQFIISFQALPDAALDRKLEPVFDYVITADITDNAGETRSSTTTVMVGYKSLFLQTAVPSSLPADSLRSIAIRTENSNAQFQPTTVRVVITQLMEEKRLIRKRYWNRPDQFVYSKEMYVQMFPHDEYNDETDPETWQRLNIVFEKTDSVFAEKPFSLGDTRFRPGTYVVEVVTNDKNGREVKDVKYITLFDDRTEQFPAGYLWTQGSKSVEPGEKTEVKLATTAADLFIIQQRDNRDTVKLFEYFGLSRQRRNIEITAKETERGGYGLSWVFVKDNRVYQYSQVVDIPWSNKKLNIEYSSFRDKTLPGSTEQWKLKISGSGKESIATEMLASMYDASLDQFYPFRWTSPDVWPTFPYMQRWGSTSNFTQVEGVERPAVYLQYRNLNKQYDELLTGQQRLGNTTHITIRGMSSVQMESRSSGIAAPAPKQEEISSQGYISFSSKDKMVLDTIEETKAATIGAANQQPTTNPTQIRTNFNETAFFLPDLRTDSYGNIEFSFTMPEALTRWKFQALAQTRDLAFGYSSKEIVTQKQLMVQPNPTRFVRQGDKMEFSAKIVNMTAAELTGTAQLQLFNATTNEPVDGRFMNVIPQQFFTVAAGQSEAIRFPMEIPYQYDNALVWRIVAKAGEYSDGEENVLPVLTNRTLVTESLPLSSKGNGTSDFSFDKLLNSGNSETLTHQSLTVEYTSNPVWLAVQSLPYLLEYPYDCAEQTWNRYYANSLGTMLANSSPKLKAVFDKWAKGAAGDSTALLSNLLKNQELKSVMAEETPWLLQAKTESEQRKNIALLFDMARMSTALDVSLDKLREKQSSNGGFVWFTGGPDDRYMTQYIVSGIGHLMKLNAVAAGQKDKLQQILATAIPYLDKRMREDYEQLVKSKQDLKKYQPEALAIQYLYMRSFFPDIAIAKADQPAYNYFMKQLPAGWKNQSRYMQALAALVLNRKGDKTTATAILHSLKENSILNPELGRYWKDASYGWWWYESALERQAVMVEAFQEISNDQATVDELRTWLIRNKQTNNWESTKATAEACYALLLNGSNWINNNSTVQIRLGNKITFPTGNEVEAGTGYFKQTIAGQDVRPEMGKVGITISDSTVKGSNQPGWGAVYWQYFEDLDKITSAATPLSLVKKLFIQRNTDRGPELKQVNDGDALKVGDKITVRIELKVDREMEYVHMKDMRAAALEPINVISSYKYQGGLGYYESTRDASTNFFFNNLRRGTYVFEYSLFVTNTGNFSNGITTIQCMYAPEFSAHSEGIRINVER